jgi:hypothetical protein
VLVKLGHPQSSQHLFQDFHSEPQLLAAVYQLCKAEPNKSHTPHEFSLNGWQLDTNPAKQNPQLASMVISSIPSLQPDVYVAATC